MMRASIVASAAAAVLLVALLALSSSTAVQAADPSHCEVCVSVVQRIIDAVPEEDRGSQDAIEQAVDKVCERKDLSRKDKKACYFLSTIKRQVANPIKYGIPALKVCEKLTKTNAELCEMRYPVNVESSTDYNSLRIKQLKQILTARGVTCNGCTEKADYVKKCEETKHLEAPGEL